MTEGKWKPIETAPVDGTAFLALFDNDDQSVVWFDKYGPMNAPWFDGERHWNNFAFQGWSGKGLLGAER